MKNLFTVIVNYSNNAVTIEQHEERTPLLALIQCIRVSDALDGYDRDLIEESISHLHHRINERGIWTFTCKSRYLNIIGGIIIQTDKTAYLRPHH